MSKTTKNIILVLFILATAAVLSGGLIWYVYSSQHPFEFTKKIAEPAKEINPETVADEFAMTAGQNYEEEFNGDGTVTRRFYLDDIKYRTDDGDYEMIDNTVVPSDGEYAFENTTNTSKTYFKADVQDEAFIKFNIPGERSEWETTEEPVIEEVTSEVTGESMPVVKEPAKVELVTRAYERSAAFSFVNAAVSEPQTEGNIITYPDIYDGIDAKYTISTGSLLEELVVEKQKPIDEISQQVTIEGAYYKEQADGSITFHDIESKNLVFTSPRPVMYELENRDEFSYGLHYEITDLEDNSIIIKKVIDENGQAWLENAEYPVVIDNTYIVYATEHGLNGMIRMWHNDGNSDKKYTAHVADYPGGQNVILRTGTRYYHFLAGVSVKSFYDYRNVFSFDTSPLPDGVAYETIIDVNFQVIMTGTRDCLPNCAPGYSGGIYQGGELPLVEGEDVQVYSGVDVWSDFTDPQAIWGGINGTNMTYEGNIDTTGLRQAYGCGVPPYGNDCVRTIPISKSSLSTTGRTQIAFSDALIAIPGIHDYWRGVYAYTSSTTNQEAKPRLEITYLPVPIINVLTADHGEYSQLRIKLTDNTDDEAYWELENCKNVWANECSDPEYAGWTNVCAFNTNSSGACGGGGLGTYDCGATTKEGTGGVCTITNTGLDSDREYFYRARVFRTDPPAGNSSWSATDSDYTVAQAFGETALIIDSPAWNRIRATGGGGETCYTNPNQDYTDYVLGVYTEYNGGNFSYRFTQGDPDYIAGLGSLFYLKRATESDPYYQSSWGYTKTQWQTEALSFSCDLTFYIQGDGTSDNMLWPNRDVGFEEFSRDSRLTAPRYLHGSGTPQFSVLIRTRARLPSEPINHPADATGTTLKLEMDITPYDSRGVEGDSIYENPLTLYAMQECKCDDGNTDVDGNYVCDGDDVWQYMSPSGGSDRNSEPQWAFDSVDSGTPDWGGADGRTFSGFQPATCYIFRATSKNNSNIMGDGYADYSPTTERYCTPLAAPDAPTVACDYDDGLEQYYCDVTINDDNNPPGSYYYKVEVSNDDGSTDLWTVPSEWQSLANSDGDPGGEWSDDYQNGGTVRFNIPINECSAARYYRVFAAQDNSGYWASSESPSGTDTLPPCRPGKPSAQSKTHDSITWNWTPSVSGEAITAVEYSDNGGIDTNFSGTTPPQTQSGLTPNSSHIVKVRACDRNSPNERCGAWSENSVGVYTDAETPSVDVECDYSSSYYCTVTLGADQNPQTTTDYKIEVSNDGIGWTTIVPTGYTPLAGNWIVKNWSAGSTKLFTFSSLTCDTSHTTYYYRVSVRNYNDEPTSDPNSNSDTLPPCVPGIISHSNQQLTSLRWNWSAPSGGEVVQDYKVVLGGCTSQSTNYTSNTFYDHNGASINTECTILLTARDARLRTGESQPIDDDAYTSIQPVTGIGFDTWDTRSLSFHATPNPSNLSGASSGTSGISFREQTGTGWSAGYQKTNSGTHSGLIPNTEYCYQGRTRNGNSDYTSWGPATAVCTYTHAEIPDRPALEHLTGGESVNLTLRTANDDNPDYTRYAICVKKYDEVEGTDISKYVLQDNHPADDGGDGLDNGVAYVDWGCSDYNCDNEADCIGTGEGTCEGAVWDSGTPSCKPPDGDGDDTGHWATRVVQEVGDVNYGYEDWGDTNGITIAGLSPSSKYDFRAKARNENTGGALAENWTNFGPEATLFLVKNNIVGWAWSSSIGWVSMNCLNMFIDPSHGYSCGVAKDWGLNAEFEPTRDINPLEGYAWSASGQALTNEWQEPTNISSSLTGIGHNTAFDSQGNPHIVWTDVDGYFCHHDATTPCSTDAECGPSSYCEANNVIKYLRWSPSANDWVDYDYDIDGITDDDIIVPKIRLNVLSAEDPAVNGSLNKNCLLIDGPPRIALDSNNNPHILWRQEHCEGGVAESWKYAGVYYQYWDGSDGSAWQEYKYSGDTCDRTICDAEYGSVLALDNNDLPHVAWSGGDWADAYIEYRHWDLAANGGLGAWVTVSGDTGSDHSKVDQTITASTAPTLRLSNDAIQQPHIAWEERREKTCSNDRNHACQDGADCGGGTCVDPGDMVEGNVYYRYWDPAVGEVGEWVTASGANDGDEYMIDANLSVSQIDPPWPNGGLQPNLALDSNGDPNIAYTANDNDGSNHFYVYFRKWDDLQQAWVTVSGDATSGHGGDYLRTDPTNYNTFVHTRPSFVLDGDDQPHIAWADSHDYVVYYRHWSQAQNKWVTVSDDPDTADQSVGTVGQEANSAALGLGQDGTVHMIWRDRACDGTSTCETFKDGNCIPNLGYPYCELNWPGNRCNSSDIMYTKWSTDPVTTGLGWISLYNKVCSNNTQQGCYIDGDCEGTNTCIESAGVPPGGITYGFCYNATPERHGKCLKDGTTVCIEGVPTCPGGDDDYCVLETCSYKEGDPANGSCDVGDTCRAFGTANFSGITREIEGWARILTLKDEGAKQGFYDWGWTKLGGDFDDGMGTTGSYKLSGTEVDSQLFLGDPDVNPDELALYSLIGWAWDAQIADFSSNSLWLNPTDVSQNKAVGVDSFSDRGKTSMVIDSVGDPHMAWVEYDKAGGSYNINYVKLEGGRWITAGGDEYRPGSIDPTLKINGDLTDSRSPSLALDTSDNPHIAWQEDGSYNAWGTVYYSSWDSVNNLWITPSQVDTDAGTPSLQIDLSGRPHVAYRKNIEPLSYYNTEIYYRWWDESTSNWVDIDAGADDKVNISNSAGDDRYSRYPDLVLDSQDRPHIVWQEKYDILALGTYYNHIFYRWWDATANGGSGGWVDADPDDGYDDDVSVNWGIRTCDGTYNGTKCAVNTDCAVTGNCQGVDSNLPYKIDGNLPTIDLYSDDTPGIVWRDPYTLVYRRWDSIIGGWVDADPGDGDPDPYNDDLVLTEGALIEHYQYQSLVIGDDDQPRIAWSEKLPDPSEADIRYSFWNGSAWVTADGVTPISEPPLAHFDVSRSSGRRSISPVLRLDRWGNTHVSWTELNFSDQYCGAFDGDGIVDDFEGIARDIEIDEENGYMYIVGKDTARRRIEKRSSDTGQLCTGDDCGTNENFGGYCHMDGSIPCTDDIPCDTVANPGDYCELGFIAFSGQNNIGGWNIVLDDNDLYVTGIGGGWWVGKYRQSDGWYDSSWGNGIDSGGYLDVPEGDATLGIDIQVDDIFIYLVGYDDFNDWRIEKRWKSNGDRVVGFGGNGGDPEGVITVPSGEEARKLVIDDMYMYIVGYDDDDTAPDPGDWRIEKRLLIDGSLVSGFDSGGVATGPTVSHSIYDVAIDSDYIYIAGRTDEETEGGEEYKWLIGKYSKDNGNADGGFGDGGLLTITENSFFAHGISVQNDVLYITGNRGGAWRYEKRSAVDGSLIAGTFTDGWQEGIITAETGIPYENVIDSDYIYTVGNWTTEWRIEKRWLTTGQLDNIYNDNNKCTDPDYPQCLYHHWVSGFGNYYECVGSDILYSRWSPGKVQVGLGWMEFMPAGALMGIPWVQTMYSDIYAAESIQLAPPPRGSGEYTATYLIMADGSIQGVSEVNPPTTSFYEEGFQPLIEEAGLPFGENVLSKINTEALTATVDVTRNRYGHVVVSQDDSAAAGPVDISLDFGNPLDGTVYYYFGASKGYTIDNEIIFEKGDSLATPSTSGNGLIVIDGDLEINANVLYSNGTLSDISEMPSAAFIVEGNINVSSMVNEISGVFVAKGGEGVISTSRVQLGPEVVSALADDTYVSYEVDGAPAYENNVNDTSLRFGYETYYDLSMAQGRIAGVSIALDNAESVENTDNGLITIPKRTFDNSKNIVLDYFINAWLWIPVPKVNINYEKVESIVLADIALEDEAKVFAKFKQAPKPLNIIESDFSDIEYIGDHQAGTVNEQGLEELLKNPDIEAVYLDQPVSVLLDEAVPLVKADLDNYDIDSTGAGQKICVIDTGVDYDHPAITNYTLGYDFVNNDDDPMDDHGHGTSVAGVISRVALGSELLAAKVIDQDGFGYESTVYQGLQWCVDQDADIINFSIGSGVYNGFCDQNFVAELVNTAVQRGIFVTAATGNDGINGLKAPSCASKVTRVSATDKLDNIADFANVSLIVDMLAPGEAVTVPVLGDDYDSKSGTSISAPIVAAGAALILENESLSPSDLKYRLRSTGELIEYTEDDTTINISRLDVYSAVENNVTMEPYDYEAEQGDEIGGDYVPLLVVCGAFGSNRECVIGEACCFKDTCDSNGNTALLATCNDCDGSLVACQECCASSGDSASNCESGLHGSGFTWTGSVCCDGQGDETGCCSAAGESCSVNGDCCSGYCRNDYDGGKFCAEDSDRCVHDGVTYAEWVYAPDCERVGGGSTYGRRYRCVNGSWNIYNCGYGSYSCYNDCQRRRIAYRCQPSGGTTTCTSSGAGYYYNNCSQNYWCSGSSCINTGSCGFSSYNKCGGVGSPNSCQKGRDIYRCNSSQSCTYIVGEEWADVVSGNVCSGGSEVVGDSTNYCGLSGYNACDVGVCNRTQDYLACGGSNTCTADTGYDQSDPCPADTACGGGTCSNSYTCGTGTVDCSGSIYGWGTALPLSCRVESPTTSNYCDGIGACRTQTAECAAQNIEDGQSGLAVCGSEECKKACPVDGDASLFNTVAAVCHTSGTGDPGNPCPGGFECNSEGTCQSLTDVNVSAIGSQTSTLYIPSTNQYVGGAFVIQEAKSSRDVTGITVTGYGTNVANDFSNIKLYYDFDTSTYDCTGENYLDGTDGQFGSTVAGFSAIDGTAAFTDPGVNISTSQAMCVYVVLYVESSASEGDMLDIKINDPSNEVVVDSGIVSPSTAVELTGTTFLDIPTSASVVSSPANPIYIPTNDQYIGGKFIITSSYGSRTVDSIKITETGDVVAQNDLGDVKLFYDLDGAAPYDCADELYNPGFDLQFDSTNTGAFNVSETITFNDPGPASITPIQAMCVYVVLDVNSTAVDGNGLKIDIADPSTDVMVSSGGVKPGTALSLGTSTLDAPVKTFVKDGQDTYFVAGQLNQYLGGAFMITSDFGSRDIEKIKITNIGSVDASVGLENIKLYYDLASDCTLPSVKYGDGDDTEFGSILNFSGDQTAEIIGTSPVSINESTQMCVYVVMDILDDPFITYGDTLEIQIISPSDITTTSGSVELDQTPLTLATFGASALLGPTDLKQVHYRWRNDNGTDETDATFAELEDAKFTDWPRGDQVRLRFLVSNQPDAAPISIGYQLEVSDADADCTAETYEAIGTDVDWDIIDSAIIPGDPIATTNVVVDGGLTDPGGSSFVNGEFRGDSQDFTSLISLGPNEFTEIEFSIKATLQAENGGSYCFRLVDNAGIEGITYPASKYAELSLLWVEPTLIPNRAYMRWGFGQGTALDIPPGSEIRNAYIKLHGDGNSEGNDFTGRIYLIDYLNVDDYSLWTPEGLFKAPTSNSVGYDTTGWISSRENLTPDIKSLVQKYINNDEYAESYYNSQPLNFGVVIKEGSTEHDGLKSFYSADEGTGTPPELVIEYSPRRARFPLVDVDDDLWVWDGGKDQDIDCMPFGRNDTLIRAERVYLRFLNIDVPLGAEILEAHIRSKICDSGGIGFQVRQGLLDGYDNFSADPWNDMGLDINVSEVAQDIGDTEWNDDGHSILTRDIASIIEAFIARIDYVPGLDGFSALNLRLRRGSDSVEESEGVNEYRSISEQQSMLEVDYLLPLQVNGLFIAKGYNFDRKYTRDLEPAEKILYDGRVVANTPPGLSDFTKALPLYMRVIP